MENASRSDAASWYRHHILYFSVLARLLLLVISALWWGRKRLRSRWHKTNVLLPPFFHLAFFSVQIPSSAKSIPFFPPPNYVLGLVEKCLVSTHLHKPHWEPHITALSTRQHTLCWGSSPSSSPPPARILLPFLYSSCEPSSMQCSVQWACPYILISAQEISKHVKANIQVFQLHLTWDFNYYLTLRDIQRHLHLDKSFNSKTCVGSRNMISSSTSEIIL